MAFLGRLNKDGVLVNCELFTGGRFKPLENQFRQGKRDGDPSVVHLLRAKPSRTFIKTYDDGRHVPALGSPSTVRLVGSSISSSDGNSVDGTDMSTLRYCSPGATETEAETLCSAQEDDSGSSSNSSQYQEALPVSMDEDSGLDKDSNISVCGLTIDDNQCVSIPSLKLRSRSASDSERYSPTYSQTIKKITLKMVRPVEEAYDTWLSAKRAQNQYKHEAIRRQEEERLQKMAERQRLAKESYEQWCLEKSLQQSTTSSKSSVKTATNPKKSKSAPRLDAAAQRRLQEWEMEKVKQAERRRLQQEKEAKKIHQQALMRHKQADEAFEKWVQNVSQRPKPVPLNQGLDSLRGTISDIYINPNEWVD